VALVNEQITFTTVARSRALMTHLSVTLLCHCYCTAGHNVVVAELLHAAFQAKWDVSNLGCK
jgi:hypothetical protein